MAADRSRALKRARFSRRQRLRRILKSAWRLSPRKPQQPKIVTREDSAVTGMSKVIGRVRRLQPAARMFLHGATIRLQTTVQQHRLQPQTRSPTAAFR
jgi:hypothetical protein